jgi:hypothetical protein
MKIINLLALLSIYSLSFGLPILANPTHKYSTANKLTCQKTINSLRDLFESVNIASAYSSDIKHLKGRNMTVLIALSGKDVPKAYKLLSLSKPLKISQEIAKNCPRVGMVNSIIDGVDDNIAYGIVDGRMKEFKCATRPPIRWGEIICP